MRPRGAPFGDPDAAHTKRQTLVAELGLNDDAFAVVPHPEGGYAIVRGDAVDGDASVSVSGPVAGAAAAAGLIEPDVGRPYPQTFVLNVSPRAYADRYALIAAGALLVLTPWGWFLPSVTPGTLGGQIAWMLRLGGLVLALWNMGRFMYSYLFLSYAVSTADAQARRGPFSKESPPVSFAHVRGTRVVQAFWERMLDVGTVQVHTPTTRPDPLSPSPASPARHASSGTFAAAAGPPARTRAAPPTDRPRDTPMDPTPKNAADTTATELLAGLLEGQQQQARRELFWRNVRGAAIAIALVAGPLIYRPDDQQHPVARFGPPRPATTPRWSASKARSRPGARANAEAVNRSLRRAFNDEDSVAVIVVLDSPGGSAVQSEMIHDQILGLRHHHPDKPVWAVGVDRMTSGAYLVASAAQHICVSAGHADRQSRRDPPELGPFGAARQRRGRTPAVQRG